jgi:hypothetical protein
MFLRLQPITTVLNLFRLALRLVWPALIRFIDTKARRFIFISRNHGDEPFLLKLILTSVGRLGNYYSRNILIRIQHMAVNYVVIKLNKRLSDRPT